MTWTETKHQTGRKMWTASDNDAAVVQFAATGFALYERGQNGIKSMHRTLASAQAAHGGG
jgi:hypothetical protein